jgi:hypothetical protein
MFRKETGGLSPQSGASAVEGFGDLLSIAF